MNTAAKPSVGSVFFEGKAEQSQFLVGDGVEECVNDVIGEASFLILVHFYHLRNDNIQPQSQQSFLQHDCSD